MARYKAIKVDGVKHDAHRYLMEQHLGRKLDSDEFVHHKNENKLDNRIENLIIMSRSDHARLHQKGIPKPESTRKAISEALKGRPNIRDRKLSDEDVRFIRSNYVPYSREFGSVALAAKYGVGTRAILDAIHNRTYTDVK